MSALEATPTLTNGRWVQGRGGIRRWRPIESVALAADPEMTEPVVVYAAVMCACGCLIAIGEDCPNCRMWARENEQAANLASFGRQM